MKPTTKPTTWMTADEWLEYWRTRIKSEGPWNEGFRRLAHDIEQVGEDSTCVELEPMLEAYVDQRALDGQAAVDFAALEAHLQECEACREKLEGLRIMLEDDAEALPFSSNSPPGANGKTWNIVPLSHVEKSRHGVLVEIAPDYIRQRLFDNASMPKQRGVDDTDEQNILLILDEVNADAAQWGIEVRAHRDATRHESLTVCAKVENDRSEALQVTLVWGAQTFIRKIENKQEACFEDLPVSILRETSPPVHLTIEVPNSNSPA